MLLRPGYLSQSLDRPLGTKDSGTLHTVLDARTYMLALFEDRLNLNRRHAALAATAARNKPRADMPYGYGDRI